MNNGKTINIMVQTDPKVTQISKIVTTYIERVEEIDE